MEGIRRRQAAWERSLRNLRFMMGRERECEALLHSAFLEPLSAYLRNESGKMEEIGIDMKMEVRLLSLHVVPEGWKVRLGEC